MEEKVAMAQIVENVAMGLYQQDKVRGVDQMECMITALMELVRDDSMCLDLNMVNEVLVEAMKALEERNYVLLADILSYDLKSLLV